MKKASSPRMLRKGRSQRFYARNAVKTTLDRAPAPSVFRRSARCHRAQTNLSYTRALTSFPNECGDPGAPDCPRLIAYVGALAFFAIVGEHFLAQRQLTRPQGSPTSPAFAVAPRSRSFFARSRR
jgi:hypothetical protein